MNNASRTTDRAHSVVGRHAEVRRIAAFVGALQGGVRALFIRGEPGIGKTVLWNLGIDRGRASGCRVLVTRPAEEEMALDLVALVDLFEDEGLDVRALRAQEDPFARGRLVLDAIRTLADRSPVVLAIDDVQWLDPVSARALRYALRRLHDEPVGILATVRAGSERTDPLGGSTTLPPGRVDTIALGPLGLEDLRRVIGDTITAITRPALRRIHQVSGGNPLYAIELARGLAADGRAGRSTRSLSLPDSIGAAITHRLEAVPGELTPMLEAVAALGPTSADELGRSLPSADVDGLLVLAERDGILVVEGRSVRFSHPLFGEAVYARMPPLARGSLHARLADGATDPDVRARHVALSTGEPDAGVAALLEEASHRASRRGAFDLAAEFARHGLRLTPTEDADGARRRAHAEIENLAAAGEVSRALELADGQVERQPAGPGRAEALVLRSDLENNDPAMILSLLLSALEDAGDDDHLRARVLDELAFAHWLSFGALRDAIARAREALAIAERLDDGTLRAVTLAGLAHLDAIAGTPRPDDMQRAIAIEDEAGQLRLTTGRRGRVLLAKQLRWAGDLRSARALIEAASSTDEFQRPFQMYDLALLECAAGDFARADELVDRGLEAVRDSGSTLGDRWFLYPKALVDAWLGRAGEARSTAGRLLERAERFGERLDTLGARRVLGLLALSEGDSAGAVEDLATAAQLLLDMGVGHPGIYPALPDAIEAHALAGDLASAAALLERLDRQAAAIDSAWANAAVSRCRGALFLARGDPDGAVPALAEAAARFGEIDHRPDAARALLWQGRALLRGGRRPPPADVLADARARFAGMGAALWEARAAEELERAAPGRGSGRLTSTEWRIARLVAEGSRNREIASTLFVSVATVEAHLTRIYRKLGIRSRSDLARLVAEGLVPPEEDTTDATGP